MLNRLFEFPYIFKAIKGQFKSNLLFYIFSILLLISSFLIFSFENMIINNLRIDKIVSNIYNSIFIVMIIFYFATLIIAFIKKSEISPIILKSTLVLLVSIFVFLVSSLIKRNFVKTPYINVLLFFAIFSTVASANQDEKRIIIYFLFISLSLYVLIAFGYYFKDILNFKNTSHRIGSEFGNQDRFVVPFSMIYVVSPLFLERKKYFVLIPNILSIPLLFLSQTRVGLIVLLFSALIYLKRLCYRHSKKYLFIILMAIAITCFSILTFIPTNISIFERFRNMFNALLTGTGDDSLMERIMLIKRSYVFGITHLFSGYGFDGILSYTSQASHDCFGDIAFSYGGLFALIYLFFFVFLFAKAFKSKTHSELTSYLLGYFIIYFFCGVFLSSRIISIFFGVCFAFLINYNEIVPIKKKLIISENYSEIFL